MQSTSIRHDWAKDEIRSLINQPLLELIYRSASVHRQYHNSRKIQLCHLISIKTGGCPENCKYCAQSSHYQTSITSEPLMKLDEVLAKADQAIKAGASRICLGAAWRQPRPGKSFDNVLKMIECLAAKGIEVCCTLGMLKDEDAQKFRNVGIYAYNHNLDTSPEYYSQIVTTRTYQERLNTLEAVEKANIKVCCGGIMGLGESLEDRISFLHVLSTRPHHPESVPINVLAKIPGTPMEDNDPVSAWELIRMIATARILMPKSMVRLSSGRDSLSLSEQALCLLAGANSIFIGEKLLTVSNPDIDTDANMLELFGLEKMPPFQMSTHTQT